MALVTLRCQCGEPADVIYRRPWCATHALELWPDGVGDLPPGDLLPPPAPVVIECRLCHAWGWASGQDYCLACGSSDVRSVALG